MSAIQLNPEQHQMVYICQQHDGFYRFAKLMEMLVQGIADGIIDAPKDH